MAPKQEKSPAITELRPRDNALRVIPLGGVGEIGANCTLFEFNGEYLLVDAGQMMPGDDLLGIDYVLPDISFLIPRADKLVGIVLTHAHEDHVGALPYILPKFPQGTPVYGGAFTVALLKEKFREHKISPNFKTYTARDPFKLGKNFSIEPLTVTHSLIDAFGLAITTPIGTVIHSGDYKIDPAPLDGVFFDHYGFSKYAEGPDEGVLLLMADSTNADQHGTCPSEASVAPVLRRLIREATGQVILSCFASSLHRIQLVMNLAAEAGRVVFAAGLNMDRNIKVASAIHALEVPGQFEDDIERVRTVPPHKRLILTTGSQGEPDAALTRMALDGYRGIQIEAGDTVIISARLIPGNEKSIYNLVNIMSRKGAKVHYNASTPGVHVSGHAYRDDMKQLINLVNPRFLMPVHGEYRHLKAHAELAYEAGLTPDEVLLVDTGDCIELTAHSARTIGKVAHGHVFVDGKGIGDVEEAVIRDRKYLSEDGVVVVMVSVDRETGEVIGGPYIHTRGFVKESEAPVHVEEATRAVLEAIEALAEHEREQTPIVQDAIKKAIRNHIKKKTNRFPVILPVVMEI